MITTILWLMVIGIGALLSFIVVGFAYAAIYDWWYFRKHEAWLLLQDKSFGKPNKPAAK